MKQTPVIVFGALALVITLGLAVQLKSTNPLIYDPLGIQLPSLYDCKDSDETIDFPSGMRPTEPGTVRPFNLQDECINDDEILEYYCQQLDNQPYFHKLGKKVVSCYQNGLTCKQHRLGAYCG